MRVATTLHFDLSHLPVSTAYTLKAFGGSYPLTRHDEASLRQARGSDERLKDLAATHRAEGVQMLGDKIQMMRIYGSPNPDGIPTLVFVCISAGGPVYTVEDTAAALIYSHPDLTVLTPRHAPAVLAAIKAAPQFLLLCDIIRHAGGGWNTIVLIDDDQGRPLRNARGNLVHEYQLIPEVLNTLAAPATAAVQSVYSDPVLRDVRWRVTQGVSCITTDSGPAQSTPPPRRPRSGGYSLSVQDGGPIFGVSLDVVSFDEATLTLTVELSNTLVRHMSVFTQFLDPGNNPIAVTETEWTALLTGDMLNYFRQWFAQNLAYGKMIVDPTSTYLFLGMLGPEDVFMGVPVAAGGTTLTWQFPSDTAIGTIRVLCGSLGVNQGVPADTVVPTLGACTTAFLDLALPIFSIVMGVGEESSTLFDSIFKDVPFLASVALKVLTIIDDLITDPDNTAEDLQAVLTSLADDLVKTVLSASDVAAKLAAYFGAEEAEEAVPVAGWALKVAALLGTQAQIDQTVGEIIASPQQIEFDLTLSMDAQITILPDPRDQAGFPSTCTSCVVVAQYTDLTSRSTTIEIPDPHIDQIVVSFDGIPVGGTVNFAVSFLSRQGWLVGKGQTGSIANVINDKTQGLLTATITITELEYPLGRQTTYSHQQVIVWDGNDHAWNETTVQPAETLLNVGSGGAGTYLDSLNGIVFNNSLGLLGCTWSGTGGPLGSGDNASYAFQSLWIGNNPDFGLNMVPSGFIEAPQLAFPGITPATGQVDYSAYCFYVDPTGSPQAGYYLRALSPLIDSTVPSESPERLFALAQGSSWGRFRILPSSMVLHSNGFVVAVIPTVTKLFILELDQARADDDTRHAIAYSGPGSRAGLLGRPEMVAVSPDQTIYVLDSVNSRISTFSRGGHPVVAFPSLENGSWADLYYDASDKGHGVTYTSLSIELTGYIYVVSYLDDGYLASQFRLDVYSPDGSHLFRQPGVNVASAVVDFWRNLYTLNYQMILGLNGRVEPSVSEWIPNTPKPPVAGG
jgi:hypothetical protein